MEDSDATFTLAERIALNKTKSVRRDEEVKMEKGLHDVNFSANFDGQLNVREKLKRDQISYKLLALIALDELDDSHEEKVKERYKKHHMDEEDNQESLENKAESFLNQIKQNLPENETKRIKKADLTVKKIG